MKTNVQTFCQEFSKELDPFAAQLGNALSDLSDQQDLTQVNSTVMSLREVQQRLTTLQDKIGGQQAFLLIFGPLKSGKSTLMNAIAGAYVSEVSSLPAYPALVYVKNGERRRFEATTYEGEKKEFNDSQEMSRAVQDDHARLASAILDVERSGNVFDPKLHYPQAIRRIDVEAPAQDLAESGTVLVDTPGLYTRMNFGYDQMTRDFRDTAACAIFVVKTDNLFFEKVFEEFEDLLGCFSRIFLVSNIDTSKKDLKPDGSLEASLESRDPEQVIEAFRSLSMSATLREAIAEGRLNIYPIDLLKAASTRLQGSERPGTEAGMSEEAGQPVADGADDGFDRFLEDLTGYLNSSDYLHDFMYDSVRVARDLNSEASQLVIDEELRQSSQDLRRTLEQDRERLASLENLEKMDWPAAFEHLYSEKDRLLGEMTHDYSQKLGETLQQTIADWMESDESWNDLLDNRLNVHLNREASNDADAILKQLSSLIENSHGGAHFSTGQIEAFNQAGLRMSEIVPPLLEKLGQNVNADTPRINLSPEDIPLKRTMSDIMLLRSSKQLYSQFFGNEGEKPIPAAQKQKRLGGRGVEQLRESVMNFASQELPGLQKEFVNQVMDRYVTDFTRTLQQNVDELKTELNKKVSDNENRLKASEQTQKILEEVKSATENFGSALAELQSRYGIEGREESEKGNGEPQEYNDEDFLNLDESLVASSEEGRTNVQGN